MHKLSHIIVCLVVFSFMSWRLLSLKKKRCPPFTLVSACFSCVAPRGAAGLRLVRAVLVACAFPCCLVSACCLCVSSASGARGARCCGCVWPPLPPLRWRPPLPFLVVPISLSLLWVVSSFVRCLLLVRFWSVLLARLLGAPPPLLYGHGRRTLPTLRPCVPLAVPPLARFVRCENRGGCASCLLGRVRALPRLLVGFWSWVCDCC